MLFYTALLDGPAALHARIQLKGYNERAPSEGIPEIIVRSKAKREPCQNIQVRTKAHGSFSQWLASNIRRHVDPSPRRRQKARTDTL